MCVMALNVIDTCVRGFVNPYPAYLFELLQKKTVEMFFRIAKIDF